MTFYELYQYYLNNPGSIPGNTSSGVSGVSGVGPVAPSQGITSAVPQVSPVGDSVSTSVAPTSTGKGIDIGLMDVVGLAINPVMGIASLATKSMTGKSLAQMAIDAMGFGGTGVSTGVDQGVGPGGCSMGSTTDQGVGPGGCATGTTGPSTDQGVGPGGCDNGGGGDGGGAGAGGGDAGTGPGGCGYATGGRVGYADGSNYLPYTNFLDLLKGRGSGTFGEDGQFIPFNYSTYVIPTQSIFDVYNKPMYSGQPNAEQLYEQYLGQQTPTEDFSDYLNEDTTTKPLTEYEQYVMRTSGVPVSEEVFNATKQLTPSGNIGDYGYTSELDWKKAVGELADQMMLAKQNIPQMLFPQTNLQQIKETATSPTQYNIEATKDLVENLPAVVQPFAPAVAGVMSLPYDAIQAYQRMQPGSGIGGFAKAYAAERPLQSAYERFVGASGPLAENINKAVSRLNPFQQQQYQTFAVQNPEQAKEAAQRSQDFIQATQRTQQADGGRIGFDNGGSYWTTVQEMYDNAGGEAGTGLGLIDFANKYFPKMATGGKVGYLQGGIAGLLR